MAWRAKVVGGVLLMLVLWAPPAVADDASLLAAYNGHQPEMEAAIHEYKRAERAARRGSVTDEELNAIVAANGHIDQVLTAIAGDVQAQAPSSEHGAKAQAAALHEIALWQLANQYENRAIAASVAGRVSECKRWWRRSNRAVKQAMREVRRVRRAFRAVGLTSPRDGVGA
jgi:hypothetical protein